MPLELSDWEDLICLTPSFTDDFGGVIITGGFEGRTGVTRVTLYHLEGFQADLPTMLEARGGHACASFLNAEKEMNYIVAGGRGRGNRQSGTLSSAEIWRKGTSAWKQTGELPVRLFGAAGLSVANLVYLTGGLVYDETGDEKPHQGIYRFDGGDGGSWSLVGNMTTTRYYHAATSALHSDYTQYCL